MTANDLRPLRSTIDLARNLGRKLGLSIIAFTLVSCGGGVSRETAPPPIISDKADRARLCPPAESSNHFFTFANVRIESIESIAARLRFSDLRDSINSACTSCHLAPANAGGFTYIDSLNGEERTSGGVTKFYPGFRESAEKMAAALLHDDPSKRMPPEDRRKKNPETFLRIGRRLEAWIKDGKPEGAFNDPTGTDSNDGSNGSNGAGPDSTSDLGDCIPAAELIGFDYAKDRLFAKAESLPERLSETDLSTFDAFELAKTGTVAYNVEYPLWADNAEKGRWVHVPMAIEKGRLVRQAIEYDARSQKFKIPVNTRFYKDFYKKVVKKDGKPTFKRIETRLIVAREPWNKSLFGTYRWDETGRTATLVQTPYRDGTPFKDTIFDIVVDERNGKTRKYATPASHRCIECHMGSPSNNFVLGFTPLQLNRRMIGEAGRETPIGASERTQVERLLKYGIVKGLTHAESLPKLEWSGATPPRNIYELRAQGYFVGNCAHCHNPQGFAFAPENGITLGLAAGDIFGFNTQTRSKQNPNRRIVHNGGDLDQSHIYRKVHDPASQQGMTSQMPMHTPGAPDCRALRVVGQWIRSMESEEAATRWEPDCHEVDDFQWIDQDFTVIQSNQYIPKRADWNDPLNGMPQKYRDLRLTPALAQAVRAEYAVGYWVTKDMCKFPDVNLPAEQRRPWMLDAKGEPKRPFGEIYFTTPGSWYYRTTCMKCHGAKADGNSALARGILNWSGGSVRVANFAGGLFGNKAENLKTFDAGSDLNLSGNYLIWMAMEGTRVQFPPELSSYLGRHGAQMLNLVREKCLNQISTDKTSSPRFMDHEVFRQVCFVENRSPDDPLLRFNPQTNKPLNPKIVEDWANQATANAGWAIFEYLKDMAQGRMRPGNDECELVYGPKNAPATR